MDTTEALLTQARAAFAAAGHTIENVRRDFPEWHRGRPHYALWALDVDTAPIRDAMAAADAHLDGLLLDDYRRQAHVTLALCGFPCDTPRHADDFGPEALARQLAALEASGVEAFTLQVGRLASFTSAPFLAVHDAGGGIARLRRALTGDTAEPGGPYTPHVTVGLYAGAWPTAEVLPRLDAFDAGPPLSCTIDSVSLMRYAAPDIGGPLETLGRFRFGHGFG